MSVDPSRTQLGARVNPGRGGHGQVVANVLLAMQQAGQPVAPIGYLNDKPALTGSVRLGLPVLGPMGAIAEIPHDLVLLSIGNRQIRKRLFDQLLANGETFATAIHPSSVVNFGAEVGPGYLVAPLCIMARQSDWARTSR